MDSAVGHLDHAAHMGWLPDWARIAAAVVLFCAVAVHASHAAEVGGQRRWWHGVHAAMAAGMAAMFLLPRMDYERLHQVGLVVFAVLAAGSAAAGIGLCAREGALNPLWATAALDSTAMAYMLLDPVVRPGWLDFLFVAYLSGGGLAWLARAYDHLPVFARPVTAEAPGAASAAGASAGPVLLSAQSSGGVGGQARTPAPVALNLAAMAAAMAVMLAAM